MYFGWTSGMNFLTHIEVSSNLNQKELAMRRLVWCQRLPNRRGEKNKPWRDPTSTHVAYSSRNYFCLFSFNIFLTLLSLIMVITSLIIITATFLILRSTWKFSLGTLIQMPFSCFFVFVLFFFSLLSCRMNTFLELWVYSITIYDYLLLLRYHL